METSSLEYEIYLGRKLGRTVRELQQSLTPREFIEHMIYDERAAARQARQAEDARRRRGKR